MKALSTIFFVFLSATLLAQGSAENFKTALMKTRDGAEVVYSSDKHSFTFNIVADSVKPVGPQGYLVVNKKPVQYVVVGNPALLASDSTEEKQKTQLLGYMQYELEYVKNELKIDYQNLHDEWLKFGNKTFLYWYFDMPPNPDKKANVTKQIHLSTMCFAHVLNLSTPFEIGDDIEKDKLLLTIIAQTLKLNNAPVDFNELYKQLSGK